MSNNIFEYATRNKLRFSSTRGELSVEQLWDVPLRSRDEAGLHTGIVDFNLNTIAKNVNKTVKDLTEESFVDSVRTPLHVRAETALEVVKYIIEVKLTEETAAKKRADNKLEKEKLLAILAEKQDGKLSKLSEDEIKKKIAALEAV